MRVTSSDTPNPDTRQPTTRAEREPSGNQRVRILTVSSSTAVVLLVLFASAPRASDAASATHTLAAAGTSALPCLTFWRN